MVRPSIPSSVRVAFWRAVRSGLSVEAAAVFVGVSRITGYRWFRETGGVVPQAARSSPAEVSFRLSMREREEIAVLIASGLGVRQVAVRVGRSASTISRELARNRTGGGYRASVAQAATDRRAARPKPRRLATSLPLRRAVIAMLGQHSSPEQIAGRLRVDHPNTPEMHVSHETIYQSLYVQGRGTLRTELASALRTGRALRRPRKPTPTPHTAVKDKVMISERPAEAADRAVPGHWEGDLILGSTASGSAIGTLVERTTGFVLLLHLPGDHNSRTVADAMITAINDLPEQLRRSLTWDQGSEMARHLEISMATGMPIYFCDPASPWQRGSNENTNGLLRQYFPKSTDLSFHGPGILNNVAAELNARPRKRHGFHTPAEVLARLLSNPEETPGVALTA